MKLLRNIKSKIIKNEKGEFVLDLEITKVELIHFSIVNNNYQQNSRVFNTFVLNKSFGQLLDISPKNFTFLKTFDSEFSYIEVWCTDKHSNQHKISITLVIYYSAIYKIDTIFSSTKKSNVCKRLWTFCLLLEK